MKLQSYFAILDVMRGRVGLKKEIEKGAAIPVTITGFIDTVHGNDDGTSREFSLVVSTVETHEAKS